MPAIKLGLSESTATKVIKPWLNNDEERQEQNDVEGRLAATNAITEDAISEVLLPLALHDSDSREIVADVPTANVVRRVVVSTTVVSGEIGNGDEDNGNGEGEEQEENDVEGRLLVSGEIGNGDEDNGGGEECVQTEELNNHRDAVAAATIVALRGRDPLPLAPTDTESTLGYRRKRSLSTSLPRYRSSSDKKRRLGSRTKSISHRFLSDSASTKRSNSSRQHTSYLGKRSREDDGVDEVEEHEADDDEEEDDVFSTPPNNSQKDNEEHDSAVDDNNDDDEEEDDVFSTPNNSKKGKEHDSSAVDDDNDNDEEEDDVFSTPPNNSQKDNEEHDSAVDDNDDDEEQEEGEEDVFSTFKDHDNEEEENELLFYMHCLVKKTTVSVTELDRTVFASNDFKNLSELYKKYKNGPRNNNALISAWFNRLKGRIVVDNDGSVSTISSGVGAIASSSSEETVAATFPTVQEEENTRARRSPRHSR